MKKIAINGCNGFIGSILIECFNNGSYEIVRIPRGLYFNSFGLFEIIKDCEVVINLAGENIFGLWTKAKQKKIIETRINITKCIVDAIKLVKNRKVHFISFSAIGIYDNVGVHDESSTNFSNSFLGQVCKNWEHEANNAESSFVDVSLVRVGIVLDNKNGFFYNLLKLKFLNSVFVPNNRSGYLSFISSIDLINAVKFIVVHSIFGVINLTAPNPVYYKDFYFKLEKLLIIGRIGFIPIWVLKVFIGNTVELFDNCPYVLPEVLKESGFKFIDSDIDSFLKENVNY